MQFQYSDFGVRCYHSCLREILRMTDNLEKSTGGEEDKFEGASELFEPVKKFRELRKFWRTRSAILGGDPLYDYSKQKLDADGFLGPWQFNLTQSTIAGLPALIIPFCARLLVRIVGGANSEDAAEAGNKVSEIFNSFALPFILMLTAYVVGRAGLWKPDSTNAAKERVSRIFLYLDGAYGFYPQIAITAAFTLFMLNPELSPVRSFLFWISVWQLIVYMRTIPEQLFHIIGYSNAERVLAPNTPITLFPGPDSASVDPHLSSPDPPIWKYRLCVLFVIPAIAIGVFIAVLILSAILNPVFKYLTG
jgi:hypothetical protein